LTLTAPHIHEADSKRGPSIEDQWRAIILFGRNVASYKFALGKAIFQLNPASGSLLKLDDLALPFALAVCEHLRLEDKQATSASSTFLDGCRQFNLSDRGDAATSQLVALTVAKGFNNVIDAFHVVGQADTPQRFFIDQRKNHRGIRITDEFGALMANPQAVSLPHEIEARWRLVETAWRLGLDRSMLVSYDSTDGALLLPDASRKRKPVTNSRHALNGYQQGRCFYCSGTISLTDQSALADVDHFFPHTLKQADFGSSVDGVWNLVLACKDCNRGVGGKFFRLPTLRLLGRLHARNEYLIGSHHPLRETLIAQCGRDEPSRRGFLNDAHRRALAVLIHQWEPS
jgi:hypothetical protein